jgi:glutamate carboxypeptidase
MPKPIESYIDSKRSEMIETWRALVDLEGKASEKGCMDIIADYLFKLFSDAGMDCNLIITDPQAPKVLTGIIGADLPGEPVLLGGHYDTVFANGAFGKNPFRIEGEKAFGPGVLDMKGGLVISLYVIKALHELGLQKRPIKVVFSGDEEGGEHHTLAGIIITRFSADCICAFNMETGPIDNSLCVGRKGAMLGNFSVKGVSAHSGNNFEVGRNAVVDAAYKIVAIDKMTNLELGTNMNVAVVHGGKIWNSIPDQCDVEFSGRFSSASEQERVLKELREVITKPYIQGTTTAYKQGIMLGVFEQTKGNIALWKFCSERSKELGYGEMGHVFLGGGSDALCMQKAGVPTICSCGVLGEWNHTDREYAVVETLFTRAKLWCEVIMSLSEFSI